MAKVACDKLHGYRKQDYSEELPEYIDESFAKYPFNLHGTENCVDDKDIQHQGYHDVLYGIFSLQ